MTRNDLLNLLDQFEVRPDSYDLFWRGAEDEVYSIAHEADGWHVFYYERGLRRTERTHPSEAAACDDLLQRIAIDPLTRSR